MRNAKKVEPARYRKLLEGIDLRSLTTTRAFCFGPPSSASALLRIDGREPQPNRSIRFTDRV